MKFCVDSREFARSIVPSVEVATNGCLKEFAYEGLLTIKVEKKRIVVFAYGGTTSLIAAISDSNFSSLNYKCEDEGSTTVYAVDLYKGLTTMEPGDVEVHLSSGEIVITLMSSKTDKRSMATVKEVVQPPNVGTKFEQSVKINKGVFIKGLHSVMFAPAVEEKMFTYMCVLMEALPEDKKQILRFSAGTGGRFAIKEIEGKKIFETDEKTKIIFPKNNLSSVWKVASVVNSDDITIKTVEQDPKNNIPEQIMIEFNGTVMCIFGLENFTKYPDLTSIINYKYSNRIYSDLKGWNYAVGGVDMTYRGHDNNIHNTEVVFEEENKRFMITPQTAHACTTHVDIIDDDKCMAKGEKIWFKCNSEYLKELMVRGGKTGTIQLNFDSQELLKDIPQDKPKQMKPILIKFPEKSNDIEETKENFYMFFTVSTK